MTAVFCHAAADRKAETWAERLGPFDRLEFAVSDAAKGIAAAVERVAAAPGAEPTSASTSTSTPTSTSTSTSAPTPTLGHGLDVFHTAQEAHRVLARHWRRAEAAWEEAEAARARVAQARRDGIDGRGPAGPARAAWRKATTALERVERLEGAWRRARAALEVSRPDGRLNDRTWAEGEIAAALTELGGADWKKVRNFLGDRRSLAFLDRMHVRLGTAEPRPEYREAMGWRWWLRHRRPVPADGPSALVRAVGRDCPLTDQERESYERVSAVLGDTFRASSAVECMNSVLRMQQSRHRRMTQAMLDLKRLYWNTRVFRSGPRKDLSPYRALGLELPTHDFWELLQIDPAKLTEKLSTSRIAE